MIYTYIIVTIYIHKSFELSDSIQEGIKHTITSYEDQQNIILYDPNYFYKGCFIGMISQASLNFLKSFSSILLLDMVSLLLRIIIFIPVMTQDEFYFFFIAHILIDLASLFIHYRKEVQSRKQFLKTATLTEEIDNQKKELTKFKALSVNSLSENFFIMDALASKVLFSTKGFQKNFKFSDSSQATGLREALAKIYIMKQSFESPKSTISHSLFERFALENSAISLFSFLQEGAKYKVFKEESFVFYGTLTSASFKKNIPSQKTFEIKISTLNWEGEEALAVSLHEITSRETNLALKVSDANKSKLFASISHELKTPLNGIKGMIQIMEDQTEDEDMLDSLKMCRNNADLLLHLINSIIDLQLLQEGQFKLRKKKVNIKDLINQIGKLFIFQCELKHLSLKLVIEENAPEYIITDEERLTQVLVHLASNAVKFTYKGGITIGAQCDPDHSDIVNFWVQDTGIGISEKEKNNLFKFYINSASSSIGTQGVGLGLTVSKELVTQLKAKSSTNEVIHVQSDRSNGSKFSFSLPVDLEKAECIEEDYGEVGQEFDTDERNNRTSTKLEKDKKNNEGSPLEYYNKSLIKSFSRVFQEIHEEQERNPDNIDELFVERNLSGQLPSKKPYFIEDKVSKYTTRPKDTSYKLIESYSPGKTQLDDSPTLKYPTKELFSPILSPAHSLKNLCDEKDEVQYENELRIEDKYDIFSEMSVRQKFSVDFKSRRQSEAFPNISQPKENFENVSNVLAQIPSVISEVYNPLDSDKHERKRRKISTKYSKRTEKDNFFGDSILLADDNPFNIMVAKHLIEEKGFQVLTALNGEEAIKLVKESLQKGKAPIKLIFMDLQMPIMDGFESASILIQMMQKKEIPSIPIVALTANDREEDIKKTLDHGMQAHLSKPLNPQDLVRALKLIKKDTLQSQKIDENHH